MSAAAGEGTAEARNEASRGRRLGGYAAAAILLGAVLAATTTALAETGSPSSRGHAIAQANCARCHAIERKGASPLGIAPPFRVLPQRYPVDQLAEALAEGIVTGHPAMPEFTFDPNDIQALLTYISSLKPDATGRGRKP
jgi:mono/diheme cytochrome c family protein